MNYVIFITIVLLYIWTVERITRLLSLLIKHERARNEDVNAQCPMCTVRQRARVRPDSEFRASYPPTFQGAPASE